MIRFLTWLRSLVLSVLNAIAKMAVFVVLVVVVLLLFGLAHGDGLPGNMVLTLDLREPVEDSERGDSQHLHAPGGHSDGFGAGAGCGVARSRASRA